MPKFVIERAIPGIGATKAPEFQAISQKVCCVLQELGPDVQWVQSYVTADKIYCNTTLFGERSLPHKR